MKNIKDNMLLGLHSALLEQFEAGITRLFQRSGIKENFSVEPGNTFLGSSLVLIGGGGG